MTFLGVKKVVFWTFSMFVMSCTEVLYSLFLALICSLLCEFVARKVDISPLKLKFRFKNLLILAVFGGYF